MNKTEIIRKHINEGWALNFESESYLRFTKPKEINMRLFWSCIVFGILFPPLWAIPVVQWASKRFGKDEVRNFYINDSNTNEDNS